MQDAMTLIDLAKQRQAELELEAERRRLIRHAMECPNGKGPAPGIVVGVPWGRLRARRTANGTGS